MQIKNKKRTVQKSRREEEAEAKCIKNELTNFYLTSFTHEMRERLPQKEIHSTLCCAVVRAAAAAAVFVVVVELSPKIEQRLHGTHTRRRMQIHMQHKSLCFGQPKIV